MARGSAARSQGNVGGGRGRPRFPMTSGCAPRRRLQDRHYSPPTDEEGSDHDSAEAERRQPVSTDEECSEHESAEAERRQPSSIDDQGPDHDSAEAEEHSDNDARQTSQTRPTGQSTSVEEEGSNHVSAKAEGNIDNESREESQTRLDSNNQSFARAAQMFETRARSAWNRFELDGFQRDGPSPTPIVEQGSTAIYHSPSILQFYFTNTPPAINTESNIEYPNDNRASSISNTQAPPGEDAHNPRKRKRSENDDGDEDPESQGADDTAPSGHPQWSTRHQQRAVLPCLMAALGNGESSGDEDVEGNDEGESNGDEIQPDEGVQEVGEGDRDAQEDEGVSGKGERALDDVEMEGHEGVSRDVEGQAHTQEAPDGDTIVVARASNHQSGIQEDTEDITRGRSLSRTEGPRQRGTGSSGSEEDLYGSSVSPSGRRRPVTHEERDDQPVADDVANHSEEEEEDELPADDMHETPPQRHGKSTSGRTGRGLYYYQSGPETTTVPVLKIAKQTPGLPQDRIVGHKVAQRSRECIATLPSIPEERPVGRPHGPARQNPDKTSKKKRQAGSARMPARPPSLSPALRDEDLAAMGIGTHPTQPGPGEEEAAEEGDEGVMETIPEERSSGDESGDDEAAGSREKTTQRHPHEPESKKKKTDAPQKPFKLILKATGNPRVADQKKATEEDEIPSADQKKATEEEEVPPAGSERDTSTLTGPTLEEEEEQPPVKPPAKRQKTRRHGRG
ncbi:hypothetical protein KC332_g7316 [Hortaea werneckii]|nr:hypothetical protein KC329_g1168 [Hortaea werneckii]KAI7261382.1 hypothetical protein KC335_g10765 [Hortaea werneckii]KAI7408964.1 hypothetical protein KC332_g7316 [Hortaea werneckii]KAI7447571.1 hypothetical protein KC368_g6413 [Hortaea werneckii]